MIEKYKRVVIVFISIMTLFMSLLLLDFYVLPKDTLEEEIEYYTKIRAKRSIIGYSFTTFNDLSFSIEDLYISENKVKLKVSKIFTIITDVKTETKDYSDKLISGLGGVNLYFYLILAISSYVSLWYLIFFKDLSENSFQNIIYFNVIMIFFISILLFKF